MPSVRPLPCLGVCLGGWALFLLWAVVLYTNHDPSLPGTLTAAIVSALSCATLGTIGWASLDLLDQRAAERIERLEAAIYAAREKEPAIIIRAPRRVVVTPKADFDPTVLAAVRRLRLRMQVIDGNVRH